MSLKNYNDLYYNMSSDTENIVVQLKPKYNLKLLYPDMSLFYKTSDGVQGEILEMNFPLNQLKINLKSINVNLIDIFFILHRK